MEPLRMAAALSAAARDAWHDADDRNDLYDDVGMGADGTPTSRIDLILDDAILEVAADLQVAVVSEESGLTPAESELTAYVDPLDGSRNAARGIPFFCTSIAIANGPGMEGLLAGHVRSLVTDDTYAAKAGGGAFCNGVSCKPRAFTPDDVLVAVIADSNVDDIKREQQRRGHRLRDLGSAAMELCLVATGALDAFVVQEPWLRNIDIAAGALLVQEAGGIIQSGDGSPLPLDFDLMHRLSLVAAGGPAAMEAVL